MSRVSELLNESSSSEQSTRLWDYSMFGWKSMREWKKSPITVKINLFSLCPPPSSGPLLNPTSTNFIDLELDSILQFQMALQSIFSKLTRLAAIKSVTLFLQQYPIQSWRVTVQRILLLLETGKSQTSFMIISVLIIIYWLFLHFVVCCCLTWIALLDSPWKQSNAAMSQKYALAPAWISFPSKIRLSRHGT